MLEGILSFRIEETIKKINDEDLTNNFVRVFPSDKMTKCIDFKQMFQEKKC